MLLRCHYSEVANRDSVWERSSYDVHHYQIIPDVVDAGIITLIIGWIVTVEKKTTCTYTWEVHITGAQFAIVARDYHVTLQVQPHTNILAARFS